MDISISRDFDNFIKEQMATGLYSSVNDIIQEALSLLRLKKSVSQISIDKFNEEIAQGEADIKAGRFSEAKEFFKGLIAQYD